MQSGTLIMAANMSSVSSVSVLNSATLLGTGTIAGPTTIQSGGLFSPGGARGTTGIFTFGSGGLTLAGQTILDLSGTTRGTLYDGVNLSGGLAYGGSLLLQFSGTLPEGSYDLFSGFGSQAGSFSSISLAGGYSGSLLDSSGVWSGTFGSQTMTFTNSTGTLVIVPEPSAALLLSLGSGGMLAGMCRRFRKGCWSEDA